MAKSKVKIPGLTELNPAVQAATATLNHLKPLQVFGSSVTHKIKNSKTNVQKQKKEKDVISRVFLIGGLREDLVQL